MSWFGADIHDIESSSPEQIHSSMLMDDSGECHSTSLSQTVTFTSEDIEHKPHDDMPDNSVTITNMKFIVCNGERDHHLPIANDSDEMPDLQDSILSTIFEESREYKSHSM